MTALARLRAPREQARHHWSRDQLLLDDLARVRPGAPAVINAGAADKDIRMQTCQDFDRHVRPFAAGWPASTSARATWWRSSSRADAGLIPVRDGEEETRSPATP